MGWPKWLRRTRDAREVVISVDVDDSRLTEIIRAEIRKEHRGIADRYKRGVKR